MEHINVERLLARDVSRCDNTPIFTVCFGPKRRLEALPVFLLCGPADSDSSLGPVVPSCRPPDVLFQCCSGLFFFFF